MFSAATKTGSQPSAAANYIEDVFSTWLYTGNDSTQTITNGIDLAGEGGLVWIKARNTTTFNCLFDTNRGGDNRLVSNTTNAQSTYSGNVTSFNSNGFSIGDNTQSNQSGFNYVSWTFRKQPKFFDVVTYTGDGASERQVNHSLGSAPGMVIVKSTSNSANWAVWHRSLGATSNNMYLNLTAANGANADFSVTGAGTMSSTSFCVSSTLGLTNANGQTYVAYLFAHNAGGFGTSGTDNVISCGSFTTNGSANATVNLGYEPQWLLVKSSSEVSNWWIIDNMRGFSQTQGFDLKPNTSGAEGTTLNGLVPTATGFQSNGALNSSTTYIYMAIRRPMKVPTDATTVFRPVFRTGTSSNTTVVSGFVTDNVITGNLVYSDPKYSTWDRLRANNYLLTTNTNAGVTAGTSVVPANPWDVMNGFKVGSSSGITNGGNDNQYATYMFARRPGFFDVVCYTGTGANRTVAHNLTVVPELMIVKTRTLAGRDWAVYSSALGATKYLYLNTTSAEDTFSPMWNDTAPTSSVFTVGTTADNNAASETYVAYLFATCPGVSKVGSYTGNGGTQAIACGFTGGARFVLIKRTDASGDWYVYDTARGMTVLTDPYLRLNSTAAEVATLGSVTTTTGGFTVNASILAAINTNAASYIFLAIA